MIAVAVASSGPLRPCQEDRLFLLDTVYPGDPVRDVEQTAASDEPVQFFAVADGLGGPGAGDRAARLVLDHLHRQRRQLRPDQPLDFAAFSQQYISQAHAYIRETLNGQSGLPCGTTIALLVLDHRTAHLLSLGNSRIYLFRSGRLQCLTTDHVVADGENVRLSCYLGSQPAAVTSDQSHPLAGANDRAPGQAAAASNPGNKRIVSQADYANLDCPACVHYLELQRGDLILLCTDGLTAALSDPEIEAVLQTPAAFIQQIHQLRDLALSRPVHDNLAMIGIKIQQLPPETQPRPETLRQFKKMRQILPFTHIYSRLVRQRPNPVWRWCQASQPALLYFAFVLLGLLLGLLIFWLPV